MFKLPTDHRPREGAGGMKARWYTPDVALALVAGLVLGAAVATAPERLLANDIDRAKAACGYDPHPISDVAWELVRQNKIPVGTAWYYTGIVRSANQHPADCMRNRLEPGWTK